MAMEHLSRAHPGRGSIKSHWLCGFLPVLCMDQLISFCLLCVFSLGRVTCRYPFLRNICRIFEPMLGTGSTALLTQLLLCNTPKFQCFVPFPRADRGQGLQDLPAGGPGCFQLHLSETGYFVHWLAEMSVSRCWNISFLAVRVDMDQLRSRC